MASLKAPLLVFSILMAFSYVEPHPHNNINKEQQYQNQWENTDDCDVTKPEVTSIENGTHGEFPWMVAIFNIDTKKYVCGGSLIAADIVLTAAHCVADLQNNTLIVRAGPYMGNLIKVLRKVKQIVLHKNFNNKNLHNDVALLYLHSAFDLNENTHNILIAKEYTNLNYDQCYANVWVKDESGSVNIYQNNLQKIHLPIISNDKCQEQLQKTKLGIHFKLDKSFMCAGGKKNKDTCKGDGGSPLICRDLDENRYYQLGMVSWGMECNQEDVPAVYADLRQVYPNNFVNLN